MKLIDGKSVLLGLGLGVIITSFIGMIFFLGYQPQLSDAEIILRAQKLGMIDQYDNSGDIKRNPDGSLLFVIRKDEPFTEVSRRLYEAEIIESSIEFEIMLKKEKLEKAIVPGEYSIGSDDDAKSIIKKITRTE